MHRLEARQLVMEHITDMRNKSSRDVADSIVDAFASSGALVLLPVPDDEEIADILQCSRGSDVISKLAARGFVIHRTFNNANGR